MIQINNGVASGIGDDGLPFSHYVMEGLAYQQMVQTASAQAQLAGQNAAVRQKYLDDLNVAQQAVEKGGNPPAPPKPTMRVIYDSGRTADVTFDPPLPDLKPGTVAGPTATQQIAAIRAANANPQDMLLQGMAMVLSDLAAIKTALKIAE